MNLDFLPRFYRLATVSVLSNMMVPLAGLADTAFLGHLEDIRDLGGVILGSLLFDYLYRVLKFLRNSTNALTAEAQGQADELELQAAKLQATQLQDTGAKETGVMLALLRCGLVAIALALVILALQYPIKTLGFAVLSGTPAIEASGLEYFNARIWGAPAVLLNFVLLGWFLGQERTGVVLLMSLAGNLSNVLMDYWMILRWDWGSSGAGLATALSQYLALGLGLVAIATKLNWPALTAAYRQVWDWPALQSILKLKANILIRFVVLISTYAIFTNLSAGFGTEVLASNGLLLQIALLSQFTVQGIGMTTQTLVGNFKGKGELEATIPVLLTAIAHALVIALGLAGLAIGFPQSVFGILTNHADIAQAMGVEAIWLLPLLSCTAIAFMLEGYWIGLKRGEVLRNGALVAFGIGFGPLAIAAGYTQSNGLLWSALVGYMAVLMVALAWAFVVQPAPLANEIS